MAADHVAQGGDGHLRHGLLDIADLDHRKLGLDNAPPDHRVDLDRHIVPADRLLAGDGRGDDAQIDPDRDVDQRDDPEQAGSARRHIAAESQNHAALVLPRDPQAGEQHDQSENDDREDKIHQRAPQAADRHPACRRARSIVESA